MLELFVGDLLQPNVLRLKRFDGIKCVVRRAAVDHEDIVFERRILSVSRSSTALNGGLALKAGMKTEANGLRWSAGAADSFLFNRSKATFAQAIKDRGFNRTDAIFPMETGNEVARFLLLPSQQARVARKLFDGIGDFARIGRRENQINSGEKNSCIIVAPRQLCCTRDRFKATLIDAALLSRLTRYSRLNRISITC